MCRESAVLFFRLGAITLCWPEAVLCWCSRLQSNSAVLGDRQACTWRRGEPLQHCYRVHATEKHHKPAGVSEAASHLCVQPAARPRVHAARPNRGLCRGTRFATRARDPRAHEPRIHASSVAPLACPERFRLLSPPALTTHLIGVLAARRQLPRVFASTSVMSGDTFPATLDL